MSWERPRMHPDLFTGASPTRVGVGARVVAHRSPQPVARRYVLELQPPDLGRAGVDVQEVEAVVHGCQRR